MAFEIETTVTFGRQAGIIRVWTNDPKWVRRVGKAGAEPTQVGQRVGEPDSYWFDVRVEKFVMRFRKGVPVSRKLAGIRLQRSTEANSHKDSSKNDTGVAP